jgi:hypothetical protein
MSYNSAYAPESSGGKNKCPIVVKGGHTYQRAHNGVSFSGLRQPGLTFPQYEFVESQSDISGLGLTNEITIEMWIRPTGLDGQNKDLVLFEIGESELLTGSSDWQCGVGDFAAQVVYNDSPAEKKFSLDYRRNSGGCVAASGWTASNLQNDQVYHVVLQSGPANSWKLYVSPSSGFNNAENEAIGFLPDMTSWNSTHTVR